MKNIITLLYPKPHYILGEISGALGLGSAVQDLLGNEFQSDEATAARNHSAEQAQINRDFQERMRATQYQTAVSDMKAAGLNPMLAYHQGGAGTPQGALTQSASASRQNIGAGAAQAMATAAQIRNIEAQTDNIEADTANKRDENPNIRGIQGIQNQQLQKLRVEVEKIIQDTDLSEQQTRLVYRQVANAILEGERIQANTGNIKVDTMLKNLQLPEAHNKAEAQKMWQWYMQHIRPFSDDVQGAASAYRHTLRKPGGITIRR